MATKVKERPGTVCPNCGALSKDGVKCGQAWGLSTYIRQGYQPVLCPECQEIKEARNETR